MIKSTTDSALRETICQVKALSKQQVLLNKPFIEEYDKILDLQMVAFQRISPVFSVVFCFVLFCFAFLILLFLVSV